MRAFYTTVISKEVMCQLDAGTTISSIKIDTSAPYFNLMLANSLAKALSELPKETVLGCWAPLQQAWVEKEALRAEAKEQLQRLFSNNVVDVGPDAQEPEPDPVITELTGDDFDQASNETDSAMQWEHTLFLEVVTGVQIAALNPVLPTVPATAAFFTAVGPSGQ
uniref:Uncharacterized protein n=1 Tax=Coccolithus braarudii TaxID=221442 RepID=A0A7S0L333_9EUKA|mmetsp:Transcript_17232/g.37239  ORF Transcript_17232/g.37239 Transcript_17232/m.37239 type:complete len:165 (+) Transcript_17232:933-1427(+)